MAWHATARHEIDVCLTRLVRRSIVCAVQVFKEMLQELVQGERQYVQNLGTVVTVHQAAYSSSPMTRFDSHDSWLAV